MKQILTICAALVAAAGVFAQAPNKMSYQVVIRNASNAPVTNAAVGMRISILQGTSNGTAVYVEMHAPTTNANGLASIEVGGGTVVSGNFTNINWATGPYFIKTETDPSGGSNYSITSTSQLLSVPYALFSGNGIVGVSATGDTLFLGNGNYLIVPGLSAANLNGGGQSGSTQHTCGADSVHNQNLTYNSMDDQDGNSYKTVVIGGREWMAENLKASHYRNGDSIPVLSDNAVWAAATTGATSWYNNDSAAYDCPYGKLYNMYAVMDNRNICPTGWHVPTDAEWTQMKNYLGGDTLAGGKMKSSGNAYWTSNATADNSSGFSGLPGGFRAMSSGTYNDIGNYGTWWSSTQDATFGAWTYTLGYFNSLTRYYQSQSDGYSVRCIRD